MSSSAEKAARAQGQRAGKLSLMLNLKLAVEETYTEESVEAAATAFVFIVIAGAVVIVEESLKVRSSS